MLLPRTREKLRTLEAIHSLSRGVSEISNNLPRRGTPEKKINTPPIIVCGDPEVRGK